MRNQATFSGAGAGRCATLSGSPETTFAAASPETVYHPRHAPLERLAERVAATTRTSEKTALLADYLRSLTPDELPIAAVFLTGRPFPEADQRTAAWAGRRS